MGLQASETREEAEPGEPVGGPPPRRRKGGWKALIWFWVLLLVFAGGGAAVLQVLGPPPRAVARMSQGPRPDSAPPTQVERGTLPPAAIPSGPGPVAEPMPALEASAAPGGASLPRIGADGLMPARAYAARVDAADPHPRVAVLLASIGMGENDSENAIRTLPAAVSLAFSPYAQRPERLLGEARAAGHETLISLPMEPLGYPLNDAGDHALLTGLSPEQNQERLLWALGRIGGYVGATAAMSGLRGERFADSPQMAQALDELARRGLVYLDPRPPAMPRPGPAESRAGWLRADLVLDEPPVRSEIDARLAQLVELARRTGSAVGIAGRPEPVTVERLATWANTLAAGGVTLVPVSALVPLPEPGHASVATNSPEAGSAAR